MATITKLKSGNYRIRKNYDGETYSVTLNYCPSQKEADRILYEMISKQAKPVGPILFKTAAEEYIDMRRPVLSPSTIRGYMSDFRCIDKKTLETKISKFDSNRVQSIINEMIGQGLSPKTIKNRVTFVICVIKSKRPELVINVNFPKKNKEEPYIPSDEDYAALLQYAQGTPYEIPLYLAGMGLRLSEICALSIEDLTEDGINITKAKLRDENGDYLIVDRNKTEKSRRFVALPKDLIDMIKKQGYVYKGYPNQITRFIYKAVKKLNLNYFSIHKLRHYFATKAHSLMIPDSSILETGGWSSDHVMKSVYRHADKDLVRKDIEKLHDHFGKLKGENSDNVKKHIDPRKRHLFLYFYLVEALSKFHKIVG